jgi:hypothetical protein
LVDLTSGADFRQTGDVSAGNLVSVNPGAYRLRLTLPDGTPTKDDTPSKSALERMIVAVAGWQTQIFILRQDQAGERRADLAGGAVVMAREGRGPQRMFDPAGKGERVAVLARYALVQHRPVADAVYQELAVLKFDDPILGLLAAHLLLRDKPDQRDFLNEVMTNLREMLGPDHPDVLALNLRALAAAVPADTVLQTPPMLRASWDIATGASVARPQLIPDEALFNSVQSGIEPSLPWLTWHDSAEPDKSSSFKYRLEALKGFLDGKSAASRSVMRGSASVIPEVSINRGIATNAIIADNVKVELTRSLGVSGSRLEDMLGSVRDITLKNG